MDGAGRIVIPKAIREREGLQAGTELEIRAEDGKIELEVAYAPVRLEERDGLLVAVPDPRAPKMTNEMVNELIERDRLRALTFEWPSLGDAAIRASVSQPQSKPARKRSAPEAPARRGAVAAGETRQKTMSRASSKS